MQQLNLDWIMEQLHKMLQFMPLDGVSGDVLQRTVDGAAWQPISAVSMDIHGLDQLTDPVDAADELPIYDNSAQGNYKVEVSDLMLQAPVQSVNGQTGDVVLSIPSVPVDSVNGQTGTVVLDANDVGALPDTTPIPANTSDLVNDSGFITAAGAPVQSVCSKVGSVTLDASDVGALPDTYVAPVTSVNGLTGDVVIGGSSLEFDPIASFTVSVYAGIGTLTDSDLQYRISSDKKFIMIWGWVELSFSATNDYTVLELSGPTLTGYTDSVSYAKSTALYINTSGSIDFSPSKSGGFARSNNQLRLIVWHPSNTGTLRGMIPCQLFALDA